MVFGLGCSRETGGKGSSGERKTGGKDQGVQGQSRHRFR